MIYSKTLSKRAVFINIFYLGIFLYFRIFINSKINYERICLIMDILNLTSFKILNDVSDDILRILTIVAGKVSLSCIVTVNQHHFILVEITIINQIINNV